MFHESINIYVFIVCILSVRYVEKKFLITNNRKCLRDLFHCARSNRCDPLKNDVYNLDDRLSNEKRSFKPLGVLREKHNTVEWNSSSLISKCLDPQSGDQRIHDKFYISTNSTSSTQTDKINIATKG